MATYPWIRTEARIMGDVLPFLNPDQHPAMAKWFAAIAARPAVQRAYQAIDSNPSRQKDATDKDKDRLFGRGAFAYRPANSSS